MIMKNYLRLRLIQELLQIGLPPLKMTMADIEYGLENLYFCKAILAQNRTSLLGKIFPNSAFI